MLGLGYFGFIEGIIEGKSMILNILCDTVYFVFGFMHFDLWVSTGNRIDFSSLFLFFEDGPLPYAYCKLDEIKGTLSSLLLACGERSFYLNLLFSIMSSKSMSTFFPLSKLMFFFSSFSLLASSILRRLSSLFFSIFLISSRCPPFFYTTF